MTVEGSTMRILAVLGSPRGMRGNTGRLLEEVLKGIRAEGAETDLVSLSEAKVGPCLGCDNCHKRGHCPIDDDFEGIKTRMMACDGLLLASPNYIFNVSAQMKAFMDRCCGPIHCLALEGKYGAVVETSGGGGDEEVLDYMQRFVGALGASSVGGIGSPIAGIRTFPQESDLFEAARGMGRELCRSIRERREYPEQDSARRAFGERMKSLVMHMKDFWTYEYEYWQRRGRL